MTEQKKRGQKKKDNNEELIPMSSFILTPPKHEPWMDVIPNCSKCEWFGINKTLTRKLEYRCLAQGCQLTSGVYNTANCKKNYEERN